jgi:hypothetical protein
MHAEIQDRASGFPTHDSEVRETTIPPSTQSTQQSAASRLQHGKVPVRFRVAG